MIQSIFIKEALLDKLYYSSVNRFVHGLPYDSREEITLCAMSELREILASV
jgi:hypothetical protein